MLVIETRETYLGVQTLCQALSPHRQGLDPRNRSTRRASRSCGRRAVPSPGVAAPYRRATLAATSQGRRRAKRLFLKALHCE